MSEGPVQPRDFLTREPHAITQLMRAVINANRDLERVLARHLTVNGTDFRAMEALLSRGPLSQGEIADVLGMSPASATVVADRLEALGHVERARDPHDRRRVVVQASATSMATAMRALMPMIEAAADATLHLDDHQRAGVEQFLRTVLDAITACRDELS